MSDADTTKKGPKDPDIPAPPIDSEATIRRLPVASTDHLHNDVIDFAELLANIAKLQRAQGATLNDIKRTLVRQDTKINNLVTWQGQHKHQLERIISIQTQHGLSFDRVDSRFDRVDKRLDGVDLRLDGMDHRFDKVDERFDHVGGRLDAMDQRFDTVDGHVDAVGGKLDLVLERLGTGAS